MVFALAAPCFGGTSRPCPGGVAISAFKLLVEPEKGVPIPVTAINMLLPKQRLRYEPVRLPSELKDKAKVAVVLVPAREDGSARLLILQEKPAKAAAEWEVPVRASVVGVVFGEKSIDSKKLNSMVVKNPQLVSDLTDYAEKTSTVEALVKTLAEYEQSTPGSGNMEAALHGFSSQYGVTLPKMDPSTPADERAAQLMHAVVPVSAADYSSAPRHTMAEQSTGLAANVGALFLGTPVTLAVAGAALVENMHASLFPDTDFRPAFTQSSGPDGMDLCSVRQQKKAHTRPAYLWMSRIPDAGAPTVSLPETAHIPVGWESTIQAKADTVAQSRLVPRARNWRLISANGETPVPTKVAVTESSDNLTLDLRTAKLTPGEYKLAADWDWDTLHVAGTVQIHPFGDMKDAKLTAESKDRLIAWSGSVPLELTGTDFEFVDDVTIAPAGKSKKTPLPLAVTLPKGKQAGEQRTMEAEIDTALLQPGSYRLAIRQVNGESHDVPVTVHPPSPTLEHLPLRVNAGEKEQAVRLQGTALERVDRITSHGTEWSLSPVNTDARDLTARQATIKLDPGAKKGDQIAADVFVAGISAPLHISDVLEVLGQRPAITGINKSFASDSPVQLGEKELPAGSPASFAIHVDHVDARPAVELKCSNDRDTRTPLTLLAGTKQGSASLDVAGASDLFLSLDPGMIGQSGCELTATLSTPTAGASDPYALGTVIELPRIDKFTIADEKVDGSLYAGTITGQNLQLIEKTGWDAKTGHAVQGIPAPVPGNIQQQTLKIALPWPPPSPRAPLYIWLRGEKDARMTTARY